MVYNYGFHVGLTASVESGNVLSGTRFESIGAGVFKVRARNLSSVFLANTEIAPFPKCKAVLKVGSTTYSETLVPVNLFVTGAIDADGADVTQVRNAPTDDDIIFEGSLPAGQCSLTFLSSTADRIVWDMEER